MEGGAKYFEVKMMRDAGSNIVLENSQFLMLKLKEMIDYEVESTKISRGDRRMPFPVTVEEFIRYRNVLNNEKACAKECFFCTRNKLNQIVEELLHNPSHLKKIVESSVDGEIEDDEWI